MARRLASAWTIDDLRQLSRRTTPRAVFDYVDGASDEEVTLRENAEAFRAVRFVPNLLNPVANPDLSTELLGRLGEMDGSQVL